MRRAATITVPYAIEEGARYELPEIQIGRGLVSQVIQSRIPLNLGTEAEFTEAHGVDRHVGG